MLSKQIIIIILVLLLPLGLASKKGRRGLHHGSIHKEHGGYGYSFFDRNRQDDDDDIRRAKNKEEEKSKSYKYYRGNNLYGARKADEIAEKLGMNLGKFLHNLFGSK